MVCEDPLFLPCLTVPGQQPPFKMLRRKVLLGERSRTSKEALAKLLGFWTQGKRNQQPRPQQDTLTQPSAWGKLEDLRVCFLVPPPHSVRFC